MVAQLVRRLPCTETTWDQYLVFSAIGEGLEGYLPVKKWAAILDMSMFSF